MLSVHQRHYVFNTGKTGMTGMICMTDKTWWTPGDIVNKRWRFWTHVWILPRRCWTHERSHGEILGHVLGPHTVCILIYMLIQGSSGDFLISILLDVHIHPLSFIYERRLAGAPRHVCGRKGLNTL